MTSAGTGLSHSEYTHGDEQVHFLQIWALPSTKGLMPSYYTRHFSDAEKKDRWAHIVAPVGAEGVVDQREAGGPAPVHSPNKAVTKGTSRFLNAFGARKPAPARLPLDASPPPAYSAQPSPPLITVHISEKETGVDQQEAAQRDPKLTLQTMLRAADRAAPLASPLRTASIGPDSPLAQTVAAASVVRLLEAEKESKGAARIPPVPAQVRRGRMGRTQPAVMLSSVCFWRVNLVEGDGG